MGIVAVTKLTHMLKTTVLKWVLKLGLCCCMLVWLSMMIRYFKAVNTSCASDRVTAFTERVPPVSPLGSYQLQLTTLVPNDEIKEASKSSWQSANYKYFPETIWQTMMRGQQKTIRFGTRKLWERTIINSRGAMVDNTHTHTRTKKYLIMVYGANFAASCVALWRPWWI